jgi:hypothetical protein
MDSGLTKQSSRPGGFILHSLPQRQRRVIGEYGGCTRRIVYRIRNPPEALNRGR